MGSKTDFQNKVISKQNFRIFLFFILALGAILRYWNIDFGLDLKDYKLSITWAKIDEETTINCLFGTLFKGDFNPHNFIYPTFYRYILFFSYYLFFIPKAILAKTGVLDLLQSQASKNPSIFFLIARYVSATAGTVTIYFLYRLARKVFNRKVALFSSLLLALSPLHIRESHFGTIDATLTLMILVSLLFIVNIYQSGRLKDYLMSGFLIGLCVSTKYNAVILILPLLAAHFFSKNSSLPLLIYSVLLIPLGFLIATPYVILSPHEFLRYTVIQVNYLYPKGFLDSLRYVFRGGIHPFLEYLSRYNLILPSFICLLMGIFLSFKRKYHVIIPLAIYCLFYLILLFITKAFFGRYMLPVIPVLYIFCAWFIYLVVTNFYKNKFTNIFLIGLLLFVTPSIFTIYHWHRALSQKDTRQIFLKWISGQEFLQEEVFFLTSPQMAARAMGDEKTGVCFWDTLDGKTKELFPLHRGDLLRKVLSSLKNILADPESDFKYFILSSELAFNEQVYREIVSILFEHCEVMYEVNSGFFRRQDREFFLFVPYKSYSRSQRPGPYIAVFKRR